MVGISLGTLYQERYASALDFRVGLSVQHAVAALALLPLAAGIDDWRADWAPAFIGPVGWLIAVNSIGGFGMLFLLICRGEVTSVATLFYLLPPITALLVGRLVLDESRP